MKSIASIIFFLFLSPIFFVGAQTLTGTWISHPFPATQFSPPLIRCGGTVGIFSHYNSGTVSFFDANIGKWTDKKLRPGDYVLESSAVGNIAFAYTKDSLLIAYSSVTHNLDTIKYQGRKLQDPQLWSCAINMVAFATVEYLYVFDGLDGIWQVLNISLPTIYPFPPARFVLGTDYALLVLYRYGDEPPKHYVYSLPLHSFNQIENGPLPNENMDHGYAGSITTPLNTKKLIGYSAITNQFSETEAPFGLSNFEEMGPHHLGGSVYAYLFSDTYEPNYSDKTDFYVYSTLSGQWYHDEFIYVTTIGYGGLHVGYDYAQIMRDEEIALNLFSSNPLIWSSYSHLFYQFYPDFRSVLGTQYPPGGFILGKNVFAIIHGNTAWGYNAITNLDKQCDIAGSINSNLTTPYQGKDYLAFGRYESNKDSMDIYIFDGDSWQHIICGNYGGGVYSVGTDELFAMYSFYQHSYKIEIIVYSKSLGYSTQFPLPYQSFLLGAFAKGCLFEINTSNGNFIFDSQTLIPHQFNFQIYSDWISDSIAVLYDNSSHQIFGYSTKTKTWANLDINSNINFNDIGTNVGLLTAGNNREKVYAYNGIYGTWVPLLPESKSIAYEAADNFAVVFKEGMAYAFFTERNGPAVISTALTDNINAGSQTLSVTSIDGFSVGDSIIINPGGPNEEMNKILGFGSIHLQSPLQYDHFAGESVVKLNPTDVKDDQDIVPTKFELYQNYPNPFNPSTKIRFVIPNIVRNLKDFSSQAPRNDNAPVTVKIYDVLGNEVATLVNENKPAGRYEVEFKGNNLASGIYFCRMQAGSYVSIKKMMLLK